MLDFIETIEVCELNVGAKYSLLSEYMKTCEYQRSRSLFNL